MALGIVSDEVFEDEVQQYLDSVTILQKKGSGRTEGANDVPDALRKAIGDTKLESGKDAALELASAFGISPSQVNAYARGANSSVHKNPVGALGSHISRTKERIAKRAGKLTMRALKNITDEKLAAASAPELSVIAKNAAVIIKDMEPPVSTNPNNAPSVQFIIHAPPIAREEKYPIIDVVSNDNT